MFDTKDELLTQIRLGEDNRLELKAVTFRGDSVSGAPSGWVVRRDCCIRKQFRGVLVLGIDEHRKPHGMSIEELTLLEHWLLGICRDRIKPPPLCRIEKWELPDATGHPAPVESGHPAQSIYT